MESCNYDILVQWKTNTQGFWSEHRWYFALFMAALVMDTWSTIYFMSITGPEAEMHPLVRAAALEFGIVAGPILGATYKVIGALIVGTFFRTIARHVFATSAIIYSLAAIYNMAI